VCAFRSEDNGPLPLENIPNCGVYKLSPRPLKRAPMLVGRDVQSLLEFVKAREPVQGVANDQDAPPLADALQAASNRTGHLAEAFALHI
jgi:hypothetical protein